MTTTEKITTSVISTQVALLQLEAIKHTPYYKKSLKNKLNAVLPELIKAEQDHYDKFFDKDDKATAQVYGVFEDFLKKIATVPIYDMENIGLIIDAYNKDKKSIEGIVNKILK